MAGRQAAQQPTGLSALNTWYNDARNSVDQARHAAEARGRQIYDLAIRTGAPIVAQTTADLRALGAKAIELERRGVAAGGQVLKSGANAVAHPRSPEARRFVREAKNNVVAAAHGAGDAITFGLADAASAGLKSVIQSGGDLSRVGDLYHSDIEAERAQDRYEAEHYGAARVAGQVGGTLASMVLPIGAEAQLARAVGLAERVIPGARLLAVPKGVRSLYATGSAPVEYVTQSVLGGTSSAASEAISDLAQGRRPSRADLTAAFVSGGLQSLAARKLGPGTVGLIGGAGGSILEDELNGRPVSVGNALKSGVVGAGVGAVSGKLASNWAESLPNLNNAGPYTTGMLGDHLSMARSWLRLDPMTDPRKIGIHQPGDPVSFRDYGTRRKEVEAKYGRNNELTPNQIIAHAYLGDRSQVDSFIPRDVANIAAIPASQIATSWFDPDIDSVEKARVPTLLFRGTVGTR